MLTELQYNILKVISTASPGDPIPPRAIRERLHLGVHDLGAAARALYDAGLVSVTLLGTQKSGYTRYYYPNEYTANALSDYEAAQVAVDADVLQWRKQVLAELEADTDGNRFVFAVLRGDYKHAPKGGLLGAIDATRGKDSTAFGAAAWVMHLYKTMEKEPHV